MDRVKKIVKKFVAGDPFSYQRPWGLFSEMCAPYGPRLEQKSPTVRVALAASVGGHPFVNTLIPYLAKGLKNRGVQVDILLCDGILPACEAANFRTYQPSRPITGATKSLSSNLCEGCFNKNLPSFATTGCPILLYSSFLTSELKRQIEDLASRSTLTEMFQYKAAGVEIGESVYASVLRFSGSGYIPQNERNLSLARKYFIAALYTLEFAKKYFETHKPDTIIVHHGIYVPQGILVEFARSKGCHVVVWGPSYRNGTFTFSHNDNYARSLLTEPEEAWKLAEWNDEKRKIISDYLTDRSEGKGDWKWMAASGGRHKAPEKGTLLKQLGLDPSKPSATLLTNVLYDANLYYASNAYPNMMDWIEDTVKYFEKRTDIQLIIRSHPHEHQMRNVGQTVAGEIKNRRIKLPKNVIFLDSSSKINTYALVKESDLLLIYGTKTGAELAPSGVPIVVAGEAWIRGKGFTYDVTSPEQYFDILDQFPEQLPRLSSEKQDLALRYAHYFFFGRMIPIEAFNKEAGWPPKLNQNAMEIVKARSDPGLEIILDGIISEARPFSMF